MDLLLAAGDLMICRAGANSVAEAAAVGLPAVFVPLPIGNGEQRLNALPVVNAGGGMLVADADLTTKFVHEAGGEVVEQPENTTYGRMAALLDQAVSDRLRRPAPGAHRLHPLKTVRVDA